MSRLLLRLSIFFLESKLLNNKKITLNYEYKLKYKEHINLDQKKGQNFKQLSKQDKKNKKDYKLVRS